MRWLPEAAEASALLQRLGEHLVLADVVVTDGAASEAHSLLKVVFPDLRNRVILLHLLRTQTRVHHSIAAIHSHVVNS